MNKRTGASLLNVMVFLAFTMMIAAQVFFFAKWSVDSVAEDREIMMYRIVLDTLVEDAKNGTKGVKSLPPKTYPMPPTIEVTCENFYTKTKTSPQPEATLPYQVSIHDLNYSFDSSTFNRNNFINQSRDKRIFAAMPPLVRLSDEIRRELSTDGHNSVDTIVPVPIPTHSFYLIRARAELPGNYYGANLMYQVLVSRDEPNRNKVDTLSFQEVWF